MVPEARDLQKPDACSVLRLIDPFSHSRIASSFEVSFGPTVPEDRVDLLVLQRLGPFSRDFDHLAELVTSLQKRGTKLLYDLDDNLLDTHPEPLLEQSIAPFRRIVRFLAQQADQVTVSTPTLRDRLLRLNATVAVVPNLLNERWLCEVPKPPRPPGPLRVGYFGTLTHQRDIMSVVAPLREAFSILNGRTVLTLIGISHDHRLRSLFEEFVPVETVAPTGDYGSFMRMMLHEQHWDIGLAPLAMGAFEAGKSDIKFLEYSAFGTPGIYGAHPAYASVEHGTTGLIATAGTWTECLTTLANNPSLRGDIVRASREYVVANRTLDAAGRSWSELISTLLTHITDKSR